MIGADLKVITDLHYLLSLISNVNSAHPQLLRLAVLETFLVMGIRSSFLWGLISSLVTVTFSHHSYYPYPFTVKIWYRSTKRYPDISSG